MFHEGTTVVGGRHANDPSIPPVTFTPDQGLLLEPIQDPHNGAGAQVNEM